MHNPTRSGLSETCGLLQRRSRGQADRTELPTTLFTTSDLHLAVWRAAELPRVIRRAHIMRAPAGRRLTAGSSPLYSYLCTPGSAYKSPGYPSYARDEAIVIAF